MEIGDGAGVKVALAPGAGLVASEGPADGFTEPVCVAVGGWVGAGVSGGAGA